MYFMLPLIVILLLNIDITFLTKKKFGYNIPILFMGIAFVMFFSQVLFKTFIIGFYLLIILSILSIPLVIYTFYKDKEKYKLFKENYLSNGFICFLVIYLLIFILDFKRPFSRWDEFSHWGEMVKEMFRLDKFYSVKESTLLSHKDYPPIIQLFELFFVKLIGQFNETMIIRSLHMFEFCLFIPCISDSIKKKKIPVIISSAFAFIAFYYLTLLFDQHGVINSIYTDYLLAFLIAYSLVVIITSKDKLSLVTIINLSLTSSFILLTKQMGLPLFLMIPFLYISSLIINNNFKIRFKFNKNNIIKLTEILLLLFIVPLLMYFSWNKYVKTIDFEPQFKVSEIKIMDLPGIYKGTKGESYQQTSLKNYIMAFEKWNLTTSNIKLNYTQCLFLAVLLIFLIWYFNKKTFDKNEMKFLIITLVIGAVGYAFVMLNMYVFCFKEIEGPNLASFDRYMDTYMLVLFYVCMMLFVYACFENKKLNNIIILTLLLFIIQAPEKTSTIIPHGYTNAKEELFKLHAKTVMDNIEHETDKVFLLSQGTTGEFQFRVKYYANPIRVNKKYYTWPTDKDTNYEKYYKEAEKEMLKYDYLYITNVTDEFKEKYEFAFDNKELNAFKMYKIVNNNNKLELVDIN